MADQKRRIRRQTKASIKKPVLLSGGNPQIAKADGDAPVQAYIAEVVVIMSKATPATSRYEYRLLATRKTSTMQKELQDAGDAGFEYKGQSVFKSTFGGKEAVVILERDKDAKTGAAFEYRLMATKKTSTLQRELVEAREAGYEFVGMTVADTFVGGSEVVAILRRPVR